MWQSAKKDATKFFVGKNVGFTSDDVVRVEAFIINTYTIHLFSFQVQFDIIKSNQLLVAHWTTGIVDKPLINTRRMKYMKTRKHPTPRLVGDRFNTNNTFLNKIFSVFHSYKCFLQFLVAFGWKVFVDDKLGSFNNVASQCLLL